LMFAVGFIVVCDVVCDVGGDNVDNFVAIFLVVVILMFAVGFIVVCDVVCDVGGDDASTPNCKFFTAT